MVRDLLAISPLMFGLRHAPTRQGRWDTTPEIHVSLLLAWFHVFVTKRDILYAFRCTSWPIFAFRRHALLI